MQNVITIRRVIILLTFWLVPAVLAQTTGSAAESGETVAKIAHAGPLSMSLARLGKDNENGVALAIALANEQKILIGGRPVRFEMISEDDQSNARVAAMVAQKLVEMKVAAVIGHLNSRITMPASEIYNQAGIPMIAGAATNPRLTERNMKLVFRTIGRDDQQGPAIAAYIDNELKAKTVAIVDDRSAYGEGLAGDVEETLVKTKISIVARERTTDTATEFSSLLAKIKTANPDVVFYGGVDETAGPMLKQARELGIKAVFIFGDGACSDEMGRLAGLAAEGMVCTQPGQPPGATGKEFTEAFNAKYGQVAHYAPYYYDATRAVIEAMKKADSVDPAKFAPELFNISFIGATGKVDFDSKGDRKDATITVFRIYRGKLVPESILTNGVVTRRARFKAAE